MKKNDQTKENIFGSVHNTAGQNIHHAVIGGDSSIGIPPYNYGPLLDIFKRALRPDEVDLLCRGFGLLKPRQAQKEIAIDLGISRAEVSRRAHIYVGKLEKSPFKMEIKALARTAEDLFSEIDSLKNQISQLQAGMAQLDAADKNTSKLQKAAEHRLNAALTRASKAEAENLQLKSKLAATEHDLASSRKESDALRSINGRLNLEYAKLLDQSQEVDTDEILGTLLDEFTQKFKKEFSARVEAAKPKSNVFCIFDFSSETEKALRAAGIHTTERLCRQRAQNLRAMKVPQKSVEEIIEKLAERGLSLRA